MQMAPPLQAYVVGQAPQSQLQSAQQLQQVTPPQLVNDTGEGRQSRTLKTKHQPTKHKRRSAHLRPASLLLLPGKNSSNIGHHFATLGSRLPLTAIPIRVPSQASSESSFSATSSSQSTTSNANDDHSHNQDSQISDSAVADNLHSVFTFAAADDYLPQHPSGEPKATTSVKRTTIGKAKRKCAKPSVKKQPVVSGRSKSAARKLLKRREQALSKCKYGLVKTVVRLLSTK